MAEEDKIYSVITKDGKGERLITREVQPTLDRYLKQKVWSIVKEHVRRNFPEGTSLAVFDPTAGSDRDSVKLTQPEKVTLGNVYQQEALDQDLESNGVVFVKGFFPDVPVSEESQHMIVMNGFDLFNKRTLSHTKPPEMSIEDYLTATLQNLRKGLKKGGALILTPGLHPDLEAVKNEWADVITLGRSTQLPKVSNESFDWQRPAEGKSMVKDVYTPPEQIDPNLLVHFLHSIGFKLKVFDFAQVENMGDIKVDGPTIPSTSSIHQRQTLLSGVRAPFKYPVVVLEAM